MSESAIIPYCEEKSFEEGPKLGKGSFGKVFLAKKIDTNEQVALKNFYDPTNSFITESFMYEKIKRDGMTHLFPECKGFMKQTLVLEKFDSHAMPDIDDIIVSPITRKRRETYVSWFKTLLMAVDYLHSNGICHRDIKPANVLLSGDRCVLSDLGSCIYVHAYKRTEIATTLWFEAPELLNSPYRYASDIWSLGVTFCTFVEGTFPTFSIDNFNERPDIGKMLGGKVLPEFLERIEDPEFRHLFSRMLCLDPTSRITARDALALPLFGGEKLKKPIYQSWSGFQSSKIYGTYEILAKNSKKEKQMVFHKWDQAQKKLVYEFLKIAHRKKFMDHKVMCLTLLFMGYQKNWISQENLKNFTYTCLLMCESFYGDSVAEISDLAYISDIREEELYKFYHVGFKFFRTNFFELADPFEAWNIMEKEGFIGGQARVERRNKFLEIFWETDSFEGLTSIEIIKKFAVMLE